MLCESIIDAVGNTPLVRLHRVGASLKCNLYGKVEFFNPGGSVKDRIAVRMILDAEKSGRIKPGDTLIEPTSGNTGIGMALVGAVRGYHVIITMPEKMSQEKQVVLEALGAKIIRTPTEAAWDAPESHIGVARKLQAELPNAHILDQYCNPSNPDAHFDGTAEEILADLKGKVDMVVMGAGTGGTITGVAKRIKQACPNCIVVGADPVGSILAGDGPIGTYKVEGIGYDFIPDVLERELVDTWVKTNDRQSFLLARRLIREEGLLVGGSSGSALYAALQEGAKLQANANCVVLLPDGVRNYMTKFIDDKWMQDNRFTDSGTIQGNVEHYLGTVDRPSLRTITAQSSIKSAISTMRQGGFSQLPVINEKGCLVGVIEEKDLLSFFWSDSSSNTDNPIENVMNRNVPTVSMGTPLASLHELLVNTGSVVCVDQDRKPKHIITKIDLVEWLAQNKG